MVNPVSGFLALLSAFALASPTQAAPSPFGWLRSPAKRDITWDSCSMFNADSQDPNLGCALFEVPMDYQDANAGNARLAVARYAATTTKIGTVFLNPGGPGGSGLDLIFAFGQNISLLFQGGYDIVSWDPRGVGLFTFPGEVTCFDSPTEEAAFFQNTIVQSINYTLAGGFDQKYQDELFSRTDEDSNLLTEFGKRCQKGPVGNYLQYIGTSSTVRDLASLGDGIVGQGKPIDYWGFSYGTIIGANFLNMFPERVGHVVLDGVVDPTTWVTYKVVRTSLTDAEKTYAGFADGCAMAGKAGCRLVDFVGDGATGPQIIKLLDDSHDTALKLLEAGFTGNPLTPGEMRAALHETLITPSTWSTFANVHAYGLLTLIFQAAQSLGIPFGNYTIPTGQIQGGDGPDNSTQTVQSHAFEAIVGADNFADIENHIVMKDVLTEIVSVTETVSQTFGAIWSLGYNFGWPVRSVERLPSLNFSKLMNPVLVIGNTADPITPFESAQATAKLIGSKATLVEQLGFGHTSIAEFSTCTLSIVAEYFLSSKVPIPLGGDHVQCEVDPTNVLFPPLNATNAAMKRGLGTMMRRRS